MRSELILRIVTKLLIPFIVIFALYVQFHGEIGPGGGFQAGVIAAAAVVLYALVFGLDAALEAVPLAFVRSCAAAGVLIYSGTGVVALLRGGKFLDYDVLAHDATHGQHYGISAVELGVVVTVFGVMVTIFYAFAARGRDDA